jgi:signal transduction histidine kinase
VLTDRQDVFNNIIHDLKSPLAATTGLSEVFLRMLAADLNDNQKEVIRKISRHARFALDLIEDILDIERIARGQLVLSKTAVDMRPFLDDIVQMHTIAGAEKGIRVNLLISNDGILQTDARRLKEVLNNLISNALKYSYPDTTIEVSMVLESSQCILSVKDQGVGIKEDEIDKLFIPFAQLTNLPTGNEKSTGLGLSIVKNLVELLGGVITVESIANGGTTFTLKLPRIEEET